MVEKFALSVSSLEKLISMRVFKRRRSSMNMKSELDDAGSDIP
jgi:hypothetical protein